ncbi:3-deoxy-7-phosphoheptulonate synthase [Coxiella endosymbiont of Amblyomma americanum]|uniref:3-deoxy-7-phosphoheptulonate synthase n=1 Tax=Coxiella endosymbiont of Amblyomma americanum TaxID=325775 RepID=UPI00057E6DB5|nr:3-deoxy-7-phosphoheptulonate synthase [Coxiella endosymbiont of Amblyomma americanum]AJC50584.1 phospho-2-dehydro-3-deoxyheptonate aldolase [Coxiella endosymbiont of Amblyomma americanum]AUJ58917.1 3-deoxy-7-phosphoheptulonate synthase [Coxiella-like endosymbiont of Amblyomma americanum]
MQKIDNLRIKTIRPVIIPALLIKELPLTDTIASKIHHARITTKRIIHGEDDRLLVVVGPCSINDPRAAMEYAFRLKDCISRYSIELFIIMRAYFEKPRTIIGWKGLINDPYLDSSFQINQGLRIARHLLLDINQLGVPTGSEFLDAIIPQYIADLITWSAIGARTTESQIHRELASGLSMPIGFKNGTTGNIQIAIDAVLAAHHPHHFLSISERGIVSIISTMGNQDSHVILRGSMRGTNYDALTIRTTIKKLQSVNLPPLLMIDCSHGNSRKDHRKQMQVIDSVCDQIHQGSFSIFGTMIESNLVEGKQTLKFGKLLKYGQSVTDACISWDTTETALSKLAKAVTVRRRQNEKRKGTKT